MTNNYPFVSAYSRMMGSFQHYLEAELLAAKRTNAPADAYASINGPQQANKASDWRTISHAGADLRARLEQSVALLETRKAGHE